MKTKKHVSCLVFGLAVLFLIGSVAMATAGESEPQYGGILKAVTTGRAPTNLGNPTKFSPVDKTFALFYAECLVSIDKNGNLVPVLATSWEVDTAKKTLDYHLRKGVKFHDGTDWNAEAAKWNMQRMLDNRKYRMGRTVKSIEVIDDYTIRLNLKSVRIQTPNDFGLAQMVSPTAIKTNGEEWALTNGIGTGAFKVKEFKRGSYLKLEKFEDYWRPDRPYLDGWEYYIIPEAMTASAAIQSGGMHIWKAPPLNEALALKKNGYKLDYDPAISAKIYFLIPDSSTPGSPYEKQKVRAALEYAIDRPALAKAIGYGYATPVDQFAPPGCVYYNPDYKGRAYDPEKGKKLLAEAGYPKGFDTKIYIGGDTSSRDLAAIVQNFLAEVGIKARIEIVDSARFRMMGRKGWKGGLNLVRHGIEPNPGGFNAIFGPDPRFIGLPSMWRSPEYVAIVDQFRRAKDYEAYWALHKKAVAQAGQDAMGIPLFSIPDMHVMPKNVHDDWLFWMVWNASEVWMEKK